MEIFWTITQFFDLYALQVFYLNIVEKLLITTAGVENLRKSARIKHWSVAGNLFHANIINIFITHFPPLLLVAHELNCVAGCSGVFSKLPGKHFSHIYSKLIIFILQAHGTCFDNLLQFACIVYHMSQI